MTRFGDLRHYYPSIPSTMDPLTDLALAGAPEGTIVVAGEQTAGRGRAGRSWSAPPNSALLLSVLLRPEVPASSLPPLPLIAGLAIAEGIESVVGAALARPIQLKWPNDLYLSGCKLAGVLMQSRSSAAGVEFVNLGFGINVNQTPDGLPEGASSLAVATGETWQLNQVERSVLDALSHRYDEFRRHGSEPGLAAWYERALFRGETVRVVHAGEPIEGRFAGVAASGALLLEIANETLEIVAGDLVRGPRPL